MCIARLRRWAALDRRKASVPVEFERRYGATQDNIIESFAEEVARLRDRVAKLRSVVGDKSGNNSSSTTTTKGTGYA